MKKHLRSIICIIVAFCASFSVFAVGCGEEPVNPLDGRILRVRTYEGLHDYTAPEVQTEDYIVKDGKSDYVLITPEHASSFDADAKVEFNNLFSKATGVVLSTTTDNLLPEGTKFISIGKTLQMKALNISDEDLLKVTADGVRIITDDNGNIYLFGGICDNVSQSEKGVMYSVYTFMKICFNFQYYFRNCFELDTGVTTLKLKDFDVWDIPDLVNRKNHGTERRENYNGVRSYEVSYGINDIDVKNRLYRSYGDTEDQSSMLLPIHAEFGDYGSKSAKIHNTNEYVAPKSVGAETKWFSKAGDQLCYTTEGDQESYERLVEYLANKIVNSLKHYTEEEYPEIAYVSLTQEDNAAFCACPTCMADRKANNGSLSGAMMKLGNRVIDRVYERMEDPTDEVYPYRRDYLKLVVYAYNQGLTPPTVYDKALDKYVPTTADHAPNDRVVVWICSQGSALADIYDPIVDATRQKMDAWGDLAKETWYWFYSGYYVDDPYFRPNYTNLNSNMYQWLANTHSSNMYDNLSADSSDNIGFRQLDVYLHFRHAWDSSLNTKEIIRDYFDAMYLGVADDMYDIYQMNINHHILLLADPDFSGGTGANLTSTRYFSYTGYLKPLIAKFEEVLKKVDKIYAENDPATCEMVKSRVYMEYMYPLYVVLDVYGTAGADAPFTNQVRQGYIDVMSYACKKYFPDITINDGEIKILDYIASIK